jgi:hypothetical protein
MIQPGTSVFTRTPCWPYSLAIERDSAVHGGLGGSVDRQLGRERHPTDRPEIDDRAAVGGDHAGGHGLRREEGVLEVDGDALVPILGADIGDIVPVVVRRIIDQRQASGRARPRNP